LHSERGKAIVSSTVEVDMGTTILAWLIVILGLLMIAGGVWDFVDLWNRRMETRISLSLRYYGLAILIICGGFGMLGIAQALRLLRLLVLTGLGGP
jgi:uncharacterized membrane protein YidH (DUF202 family)